MPDLDGIERIGGALKRIDAKYPPSITVSRFADALPGECDFLEQQLGGLDVENGDEFSAAMARHSAITANRSSTTEILVIEVGGLEQKSSKVERDVELLGLNSGRVDVSLRISFAFEALQVSEYCPIRINIDFVGTELSCNADLRKFPCKTV